MNTNLIYISALFGTLFLFAAALADLRLGIIGAVNSFVFCLHSKHIACVNPQEQGGAVKAVPSFKNTARVYTRLIRSSAILVDAIPKYKARDKRGPCAECRDLESAGYERFSANPVLGFSPRSIGRLLRLGFYIKGNTKP